MDWHTALRPRVAFAMGVTVLLFPVSVAPSVAAAPPVSAGPRHVTASAAPAAPMRAAAPSPTPASVVGPAAATGADGQLDVFYRDPAGGQLAHRTRGTGQLATWSGAEFLGGSLTSQPGVASWAPGRFDVVARQSGNAVWHRVFSGGWRAWASLGGVATSAPAAASAVSGHLDVFVRGGDNRLWSRSYRSGPGWSGWTSLGGSLTSGPAAAARASGGLEVVARGTDGAVWHRTYAGGWSAWRSLGGRIVSEPGISAASDGGLDVFARGTDNVLWTRHFTPAGGWSGWRTLGGVLTSGPSATVTRAGATVVVVRGADGRFYYRQRSGGTWSGWQTVDPALAFRGLGAWVDTLDYGSLTPATAVADMRSRGVRTLYLSTGRYNSPGDILDPTDVAAWLAAAHGAGIRVVGWYVPDYADLSRDVRRTLAVASYVSAAGHRFDAVGIDIEYPLDPPDADAWNRAVGDHLARVRAGTMLPIAAIPLPPVLMRGWSDPDRWTTFPWPVFGRLADGMMPQSYWTSFTPATRCAAGDQQYCAYRYTRDNVVLSRQLTGLPVHAIGGVGDATTLSQLSDYVRAARETGSIGASLYDYRTTTAPMWPILQQFTSP